MKSGTMMKATFGSLARQLNLAIIGPVGSGKGSYGKHFAKTFHLPLISVSDVLRKQKAGHDLSSGGLVGDSEVSEALLEEMDDLSAYIVDGFPRTLQQLHLMEDTWPERFKIHGAIWLDVPDSVCKEKLMGRRHCKLCGGNYNVAAVDFEGFYMPPHLPKNCEQNCDPDRDWEIRADDNPSTIEKRLRIYHEHADPVLGYFQSQHRLLRLVPYHGFDDLPLMEKQVGDWLKGLSA